MSRQVLKQIATVRVSNVDKKSAEGDVPVRLCNYTDVYYRDEIRSDQEFMQATATLGQVAAFRLHPGDVVITKDSETADDIGVPTYVRSSAPDLICGYHLAVIRPGSQIDGRYLYWLMVSDSIRGRLASSATGVTRFGLRLEAIGSLELELWPIERQRAIADYLDTETARIDALAAGQRGRIALIGERNRAFLTGLVDELSGETTQLGRLVTSLTQGVSPQAGGRPAESGERGLLKLSAVKSGEFVGDENKVLPADFSPLALSPRQGDLLVTRANTPNYVGDSCVVLADRPDLVICDLIYRLRLNSSVDPEFAAICLQHPRSRGTLSSLARGTSQSMVKLRGEDIKSVPIPVPPMSEQRAVVSEARATLTWAASLIEKLTQEWDVLQERRQALITVAVAGDLPIPGAR